MGVSTNGILAFGIDFEEEVEAECITEFEDWLLEQSGGEYGSPEHKMMEDECPVEVVRHCSGDYPMHIVAVSGKVFEARRGYPEDIDPKELEITDLQVAAFKEWLTEQGIDIKDEEPKWLLCSMWH